MSLAANIKVWGPHGRPPRPWKRTGLLGLLAWAAQAVAQVVLPAYNPYPSAPYTVERGGLAADTVAYLNDRLKGKYQFQLRPIPRERLNQTVIHDAGFQGVVLFSSPAFVDDMARKRFHWSPGVLADAGLVVSTPQRKLEYTGPDALKGLRFGGVLGNRYAGLEHRFGVDIERENVHSEHSNLMKVAASRVDVTILGQNTFLYYVKVDPTLAAKVHVSATPHASFSRHFFCASSDSGLAKALDDVVAGMKTDLAWRAILARYGLGG